ncbi:MAG: site-specific integrase [Pirellulaceae bacterium]
MPRRTKSNPRYCHFRPRNPAYVKFHGRRIYLGRFNSPESRAEYDRVVAEWLANGREFSSDPDSGTGQLTLVEVMAAFRRHAQQYYRKNGIVTREAELIDEALKFLRPFDRTIAGEFGPKRLKRVRETMIEAGLCRSHINKQVSRVRRMMRWAVSEELVPASVYQALQAVPDLRRGRTTAKESQPVPSVPDAVVEATLLHLPAVVADMVRLQRLTGARPGEICEIRPCDVDRDGEVWSYRPESHKTQHQGRERVIFLGPQTQQILRPYLLRGETAYCAMVDRRVRRMKRVDVPAKTLAHAAGPHFRAMLKNTTGSLNPVATTGRERVRVSLTL